MPCDKEGLFCTMPTTVAFLLHKGFFFETSGYYEEIDPEEPHESSALKGYRSLSRRISKLEPDQSSQASMAVAINRSWCSDRRFYSNLITNIKSHKPDGEVGVRNIHSSSMNKREGLSRWVSRELQGPLTGHTWFLTSSAQLVADIKKVVAEDSDYFVKLDVLLPNSKIPSKFFSLLVPGAGCFAKLLCIFCPVSMLCLIWFRDVFFRVVRGSGMGHRHSGCIADCSFFALGEREFAARSQVLQSFGIERYYRCRDDVFNDLFKETRDARVFQNVARKGPAVQAPS